MSNHQAMKSRPAPCIVDRGVLVNHDDIKRLLIDICHVRYIHSIDGRVIGEGEGFIQEIFSDAHQSTLIANNKIYLNINSFDFLQLSTTTDNQACFDLIQDNRQLSLMPIERKRQPQAIAKNLDAAAIEAMVTEVLTARLDMQLDDEEF